MLTLLQLGAADITATYQSMSGKLSVSLQVSSVTVTGATLLTVTESTGISGQAQFTAKANFSNGTSQDVSAQAQWQTSNEAIVLLFGSAFTPGFTGNAWPRAVGVADLSATYQGVTGKISVTVAAPPCQFIVTDSSGRPFPPEGIGVGGFQIPGIPSGARSGDTVKVQMTAGGSECNWRASVGDVSPQAGLHLDSSSVTLTAVSQSGSNTHTGTSPLSGVQVSGSGNGIVTIILDANPFSGARAGEFGVSIQSCSSCNRGVGSVSGQTVWQSVFYQHGR